VKAEFLRLILHQAGAGELGNYSESSFSYPGVSTFKANENANPTVGKKNELEIKSKRLPELEKIIDEKEMRWLELSEKL